MASGQPDYTRAVAVTVFDTPDNINVNVENTGTPISVDFPSRQDVNLAAQDGFVLVDVQCMPDPIQVNLKSQTNDINVAVVNMPSDTPVTVSNFPATQDVNILSQTSDLNVNIAAQVAPLDVNVAGLTGTLDVNIASQAANVDVDVSTMPSNITTVPSLPFISGRTIGFEDTSFVSGDSPITLDVNAALSRNGHDGYIKNDGAGNFTYAITDNGTDYGSAHTLKAGEAVKLTHLNIDSIKLTWVADSAYRVMVI